ncbi:MAG: phosphoribosylglycinamide formyltransferase 2 [Spirochaetes bacterium GWF1_31_7]|nr:MAG: phosphoribosylglycinamide formyltransferase 2 [Spirochaetes bacterium GWE1_32_154]OHD45692.1 MAG: phosphoribosylglycinamide formyltransferase 2 [Spirochaetes bacterium GWE2_31_10]OHD47686.1 MAG: phosphoribosylglycinamide formyltransferase 2 [Spirochaetes bacterium GWF1_31_7]OHD74780.1 MAG: phosphoribosylglycinamide formyltransferase 2 [Spirochaetes bacterium RIFOXYB1_FULL_32_8]HBD94791.1 formate-dependent phosphoribosylglycinamide formyltransferase [Spirochaetia bacterium]
MLKTILMLGSGELGKEFVIAAKRLGQFVIACDSYHNAPAMQVADKFEVFDMLNGDALDAIIEKWNPDIIIPEIEAIRTERLYQYEENGIQIVPSAKAVNYTMNRKAIRDLAAFDLGLKTAKFLYAKSLEELHKCVQSIGFPCVVKPLMSSSGKGQTVVKSEKDIEYAWSQGTTKSRGDLNELIVEEFISFDSEITLLTVTQSNSKTLFAPPIGHIQKNGDYQESFQPVFIKPEHLQEAQMMAEKVTGLLTGCGLWGVEFFLSNDNGVYFSELSPRPHDTGMVTLAGTQNLNQFELHLRAVLNLPIHKITLQRSGASAVVLSQIEEDSTPNYTGISNALSLENTDIRIFGKPSTRINRRMAVVTTYGNINDNIDVLRDRAKKAASYVQVV